MLNRRHGGGGRGVSCDELPWRVASLVKFLPTLLAGCLRWALPTSSISFFGDGLMEVWDLPGQPVFLIPWSHPGFLPALFIIPSLKPLTS